MAKAFAPTHTYTTEQGTTAVRIVRRLKNHIVVRDEQGVEIRVYASNENLSNLRTIA